MALEATDGGRSAYENAGPITIGALGLLLGAIGVEVALTDPEPLASWSVELCVAAVLPAGLMYAGYRLARTDFDGDQLWNVTAWSFAGVVSLTSVGGLAVLYRIAGESPIADPGMALVVLATIGALGGLACGVARAGSIGGPAGSRTAVRDDGREDEPARRSPNSETGAGEDRSTSDSWVGLPSVPTDERDADDVGLEAVVTGEQRRIAVEYLTSTPGEALTVHQLVDLIVERQFETTGDRPDREPILRRLHCIDLPKLAAAGLIERGEHGLIHYVGDEEETNRLLTLVEAIESDGDGR